MANVASARALSRQALLQSNQALQLVELQVRTAYLSVLRARNKFARAARDLAECQESLRLIKLQQDKEPNNEDLDEDSENAQHNVSAALSTQVQSIFISNIAQARLLHDAGVISIKTLTEGYQETDQQASRKWRKP